MARASNPIPTQVGDVLILSTRQSFILHVVGAVTEKGQQDFSAQAGSCYATDLAEAMAFAKQILRPGRRLFVRNIDTNRWREVDGAAEATIIR